MDSGRLCFVDGIKAKQYDDIDKLSLTFIDTCVQLAF